MAENLEVRFYRAYFERGKPTKIIGSIPYNSPSLPIDGGFTEYIKPGAFADALKSGKDIKSYWSHNREKVIGSLKAGTLRLTDTAKELKIELDPGSTSWGQDALEAVRRGDVSGFSFGFLPVDERYSDDGEERYILKADLMEVSPCSEPAYPAATAQARSSQQIKKPSRDVKRGKLNMREVKEIANYWKGNKPQFRTLKEQIDAIIEATNYREHDPRFRATGLSEGVFSDGGALLQTELTTKFFQPGNASELWTRATHIPLGNANQIQIPTWNETTRVEGSVLGGVDISWLAESATQSYTKPKLRQLNTALEKCQALIPYAQELEDDGQAFSAVLDATLQRSLNYMIEDTIINGTGAGQPQGYASSPCKVTIAKESGQTASTIVAENIFKMLERVIPEIYTSGDLAFVGHPSTIPEVCTLSQAIGTGGSVNPLWHWRQGGERHNKLCGLDFIISDRCQTLGNAGDLYLVDLKSVIATYKPVKKQTSIHVLFQTDESVLKFQMRLNFQNFLAQPITPAKGSNKLSTVVTLATRS